MNTIVDLPTGWPHFPRILLSGPPQSGQTDQTGFRIWTVESQEEPLVAAWIQHRDHTWRKVVEDGLPTPLTGHWKLEDLKTGRYALAMWDPWVEANGPIAVWEDTVGMDGVLSVEITDLARDRAVSVRYLGPVSDLEEAPLAAVRIWPSPAHDLLWVELPPSLNRATVQLFDPFGRMVLVQEGGQPMHLQRFPPGRYLVRVVADDYAVTKPISIVR